MTATERLLVAVRDMVSALPPALRDECVDLHRLGDERDGLLLTWQPDRDSFVVSWGRVPLGEVARAYLNDDGDRAGAS